MAGPAGQSAAALAQPPLPFVRSGLHSSVASTDIDPSLWFLTEVQPHCPALRAWLLARFPTLTDVDDVVQESVVRLMGARDSCQINSPRALLFATARNLAVDLVRRQRIVRFEPITEEANSSVLMTDSCDVVATVTRHQEFELLTEAIQSLPGRCRQILTLRTAYGFTHKQIAEKLGISLSTVEKEMAKGIRSCAAFFAARDGR